MNHCTFRWNVSFQHCFYRALKIIIVVIVYKYCIYMYNTDILCLFSYLPSKLCCATFKHKLEKKIIFFSSRVSIPFNIYTVHLLYSYSSYILTYLFLFLRIHITFKQVEFILTGCVWKEIFFCCTHAYTTGSVSVLWNCGLDFSNPMQFLQLLN